MKTIKQYEITKSGDLEIALGDTSEVLFENCIFNAPVLYSRERNIIFNGSGILKIIPKPNTTIIIRNSKFTSLKIIAPNLISTISISIESSTISLLEIVLPQAVCTLNLDMTKIGYLALKTNLLRFEITDSEITELDQRLALYLNAIQIDPESQIIIKSDRVLGNYIPEELPTIGFLKGVFFIPTVLESREDATRARNTIIRAVLPTNSCLTRDGNNLYMYAHAIIPLRIFGAPVGSRPYKECFCYTLNDFKKLKISVRYVLGNDAFKVYNSKRDLIATEDEI